MKLVNKLSQNTIQASSCNSFQLIFLFAILTFKKNGNRPDAPFLAQPDYKAASSPNTFPSLAKKTIACSGRVNTTPAVLIPRGPAKKLCNKTHRACDSLPRRSLTTTARRTAIGSEASAWQGVSLPNSRKEK